MRCGTFFWNIALRSNSSTFSHYFFYSRPGEFTEIFPSDVVLLEGILVFYNKEVRDLFDMKLFVDTDADTRLARRGKKEVVDERSKQGCKVD